LLLLRRRLLLLLNGSAAQGKTEKRKTVFMPVNDITLAGQTRKIYEHVTIDNLFH
jgi:hypothetical protein